jgi:hypothetical protein
MAVDDDGPPGREVQDSNLAPLGEIRRRERRRCLEPQRVAEWNGAADDDAVEVDVSKGDLAELEQAIDEKSRSKLAGRELLCSLRVC